MRDRDKTKEELIEELARLRLRIAELEAGEIEFKLVSTALEQSEEKFRKLTEKSVVGVYLVQDDVFRYVNPRMAEIFGYRVEELINKRGPLDVVFHQDRLLLDREFAARVSGTGDTRTFPCRGVRSDGECINIEVHAAGTEYRKKPAIIGTVLDITDRVRALCDLESELRRFQAFYELAVAMTAERSLEDNLALLVENARSLLTADTAFLALRDEADSALCMHTLSGIRTDDFRSIRVPFGRGHGGLVAATGQRMYLEEYGKGSDPIFHDLVRSEGLVSGIAVPVQIGSRNLGVLYAYNRSRTRFSNSDLDTLSLVGHLAAMEVIRHQGEDRLRESQESFRKLYEESRREEERYRSLLNSSADAIVIYDMEGRAQYVSQSFTRIFGWTLDELQGQRVPYVPDGEREASLAVIEGLILQGTPCSGFETRRLTKDGRIIPVSISSSRYRDHEGKPAGILVILRDISDRKAADEALRKSEERYRELYADSERAGKLYRTLLDVAPEPIVVYDETGKAKYSNPAFARVFGWSFEEIQGKKVEFVPPENWPETEWMIDRVMRGEDFSDRESRRFTKDGRVIDVSISGAVLPDRDGKPTGSVVHLRDITARKRAEIELADGLKKFQALYELALAMIAERTLDENLVLIVEKSRDLLGVDKVFLVLKDESSGDLVMHITAGIVTDAFRKLRIPHGVGLGGLVARTGQLYVVEDYFKEVGPIFHDIARAEGLFSGVAVPVQTENTNLGVLYAFNRTRKPFSKADQETLSLFGNLAAVEITRRRAQKRLLQSEEQFRNLYEESRHREELYRSLLNSSADAIVIYDLEGRAQYVNPSFARLFGWTMDEVEGRRIPFLPDAEREASMTLIFGILRDGASCSGFETKRYTRDGRIIDISISASRYHDHEGQPMGILTILRDISDRKRAEQALRESEERFRTLADVAPIGLVLLSSNENTEYINPKFTEIFGYTLEDVPNADTWFRKAYPAERSSARAARIWRAETTEIKVEYGIGKEAKPRVFAARCKDGQVKITSFRAVVLADGRMIATFLDVTAEVKAQREIVRAKDEWERTFNAVSDLILILDSEQKIVRVNRALADRFGDDPDALVGAHCRNMSGQGKRIPGGLCPESTFFSRGQVYCTEVVDETLGGVFDLRVSPLYESGHIVGSVNVARDITAFKSMERARRRAVHHLSHELKTPLSVIRSSVKTLTREGISESSKQEIADRIQRNLSRLNDIQQVVQEIVAPRQWMPQRFPLVGTIHGILDECRTQEFHRSVAIVAHIEPVETDFIDPEMLNPILMTLVKNAIENTPDEGEVTVHLNQVPSGVLLQVEDRGVGLTASDREFVFKAFYHTQPTSSYATKKPFDFNAGGKGLELMRLKILSEEGHFDITFESRRCVYIPTNKDHCPGRISLCPHVTDVEGCRKSGGTTFSVLFHGLRP